MKLLIIGYGNMAGAMLDGWLACGMAPGNFAVLNRSPKPAPEGVRVFADIAEAEATGGHDAVLLGFKPHQLGEAAPGLAALAEGRAVHSLLAGITCTQLEKAFAGAVAHVRVMPNLASRINKSPILLAASGLSGARRDATSALYDALGSAVWMEDEARFDLATALAGSGPGFVYRFIDALAAAAHSLGLDKPQADSLALAMVEGAAALAAGSDCSPGELADRVASPGGMTREGLNVLDEGGALEDLLTRTLDATARRGAELSQRNG
ncbi:pyrroline-5-carboxylate reductase family protein [Qipengyuania nanhaisediminis]|uniref:pyrroline-5-carboxylate reductase family protein n=1 Tax=Qipengyuania nanhaisediminis TaxID=604088 RepID=UPI0038B2FE10